MGWKKLVNLGNSKILKVLGLEEDFKIFVIVCSGFPTNDNRGIFTEEMTGGEDITLKPSLIFGRSSEINSALGASATDIPNTASRGWDTLKGGTQIPRLQTTVVQSG